MVCSYVITNLLFMRSQTDMISSFILDMEDAEYVGPKPLVPRREWGRWCSHRIDPLSGGGSKDNDPMATCGYEVCPDDEALYALIARTKEAARAKGRRGAS